MEVKIHSKEIIKPSSPASSLCRNSFKLSVLDQLSPFNYTSLIFFYSPNAISDHSKLAGDLKTSLSQALARFPLLAGRVTGSEIVCNGAGALFVEAEVSAGFPEALAQPRFELLSQLIPCRSTCTESPEVYPQVAVQFNGFAGGEVAVGVCFLHKVVDGSTMSSFLRSWSAAAAAGGCSIEEEEGWCSDYEVVSSLFPAREELSASYSWLSKEKSPFICQGKNCIRRFVFDAAAISDLKDEGKSLSVSKPTGVEVITAFIWKYAIKAARERSGSQRPSALTHAVDLRGRMSPPLPRTAPGNIFWGALAQYASPNAEIELCELVQLIRASFDQIDSNFIHKMTKQEGFEAISRSLLHAHELYATKPDAYGFTSWRSLGLNEVDLGWGKPLWVSFAGLANSRLKNVVILKDAMVGGGVEVWVILEEEEMKFFENNQEFLAFASLNPSVDL